MFIFIYRYLSLFVTTITVISQIALLLTIYPYLYLYYRYLSLFVTTITVIPQIVLLLTPILQNSPPNGYFPSALNVNLVSDLNAAQYISSYDVSLIHIPLFQNLWSI